VRKRVYVVYTGGTIGMIKGASGYAPSPGYLAARMAMMPELKDPMLPEYTINEYEPLLDSANMSPADWFKIANDIAAHYDEYDGFVVIHGTDTMAYTASALPFMLKPLSKPVIITGSQIPLCEVRNDAHENLITAMLIASQYPIPEVCLLFGGKLLRGCRSVKESATSFEAFSSPNFPVLGNVGIDININWRSVRSSKGDTQNLKVRELSELRVGVCRLYPGISSEFIENVLRPPLRGLVLEAYGVGNGPVRNKAFLDVLRKANERGVVMVNCTQCFRGGVDLTGYETGSALADVGVISGMDMTVEAALTKLFYLFSCGLTSEEIKKWTQINLRGELTPFSEHHSQEQKRDSFLN